MFKTWITSQNKLLMTWNTTCGNNGYNSTWHKARLIASKESKVSCRSIKQRAWLWTIITRNISGNRSRSHSSWRKRVRCSICPAVADSECRRLRNWTTFIIPSSVWHTYVFIIRTNSVRTTSPNKRLGLVSMPRFKETISSGKNVYFPQNISPRGDASKTIVIIRPSDPFLWYRLPPG
jgi:hypothetical protein